MIGHCRLICSSDVSCPVLSCPVTNKRSLWWPTKPLGLYAPWWSVDGAGSVAFSLSPFCYLASPCKAAAERHYRNDKKFGPVVRPSVRIVLKRRANDQSLVPPFPFPLLSSCAVPPSPFPLLLPFSSPLMQIRPYMGLGSAVSSHSASGQRAWPTDAF